MENTLLKIFNQYNKDLKKIVNDLNESADRELNTILEKNEKYRSIVVDDVQAYKKVVAQINKEKADLDAQRKQYKKIILDAFYSELDATFKSGFAAIDEIKENINKQILDVELSEKEEKLNAINALIDNFNIPLDRKYFFNNRWLNKSYSMRKITDELVDIKTVVDSDLEILSGVGDQTLINFYLQGNSLAETLKLNKDVVKNQSHTIRITVDSIEDRDKVVVFCEKFGFKYD